MPQFLDKDGLARLVANMDVAYAQKEHTHDYSPTDHNHDDRYYTESEIDSKLSGKANTSHGNHVPTTETANNARFLRNDNTWQTVTPANIGAAASSHTHTSDKITGMTGYSKPTSTSAITTSDTLNAAIGKLEKALDDKQASGSYVPTSRKVNGKALSADITLTASDVGASASGHNHNDMYYTEAEVDSKLSGKANSSHTHAAADITSVNASAITGVIAAANLPSYVDDVLEYAGTDKFPATGEAGKIYTDTTTNKIYRWGGSSYVVISDTIALGETASTAYRGDRGKIAYDHSQATGNPHGTTIANISGLQSALDGKAPSSHGNHVPTIQTADNATFLRNDNTWQKVTPANIGAAASSHNQASNTINAMTGYSKASSVSAIATSDSLNTAIGKLEKALDGKQASGSYAAATHTHTKSQITDFPASLKNPNSLTISLNGTSQGAYDGSAAKSINITPASIGAATSGHEHAVISNDEIDALFA